MTTQNARLLVLGMGGVLAASAVLGKGAVLSSLAGKPSAGDGGGSRYQRLWSVGVVVLVLSLAADLAPDLVGPFAGLVLLGWFASGSRTPASARTSPGP